MLKVVASCINIHSCVRLNMLRYTRCNTVILMAATAWLMLSFSFCIVRRFDSYTVLFKCPKRTFFLGTLEKYGVRIKSAHDIGTEGQHQPGSCSHQNNRYIGYTSTWWQHNCWPPAQTLYAIYILMPERISQGYVQNGRWVTFSWPTLYIVRLTKNLLQVTLRTSKKGKHLIGITYHNHSNVSPFGDHVN